MPYRPWGQLHWIFDHYPDLKWDLFGSFSTEERCLAVRAVLGETGKLRNSYLAKINDRESHYKDAIPIELNNRYKYFKTIGGINSEIHDHDLFEQTNKLVSEIKRFLQDSGGNIIVDISSLPKRFFFPAVKLVFRDSTVQNLAACYTIPEKYTSREMAEDFEDWRPLPLFDNTDFTDSKTEIFFVGAGHMAMGLPEQIKAVSGKVKVRVFIPFPGHPDSFKRMWEFVQDIERNVMPPQQVECKMVSARDVPEVFEYLVAETNKGSQISLLAPYGPKPISLAMCIFACQVNTDTRVYYTQPHVYPPDYSVGVATINGMPQIYTYCLRLAGKDLYAI